MTTDSRLVAFLYVLLHDIVPAKVIEDVARRLDDLEGGEGYDLPNDTLGQLANELAGRIR